MAKKIIVNEEEEIANTNGLLILFFIVVAIFIGSLSFIAGIIYTSYLDGKNEDDCIIIDKKIEEVVDDKSLDDYIVNDVNVIDGLKQKVDNIDIMTAETKEKYIYNYLEDSKNYYVMVALGSYEQKGDTTVVYTSIDKKDVYKEYSKKEKFELNEDNYSEFSKYKVTFAKDGNDTSFKSIERID